MRWSWRIGRILGVEIYVHAGFLLLLAWVAWMHARLGEGAREVVAGVVFTVAIFACVLFHELGHALAARGYGIGTRNIVLLPIGGLARLERIPEEPRQELVIALAGPLVNAVIAALLFGWLSLSDALQPLESVGIARGHFLERLMLANLFLGLFNLLPAFPMDGGRVLRALLALRLPYVRATTLAARLGKGIAVFFAVAALVLGNPFLFLIALFVWLGAGSEAGRVRLLDGLEGVGLDGAMLSRLQALGPDDSLDRAAGLLLTGSQKDFPVLANGRLVGLLQRADLMQGLAELGRDARVSQVMRRKFPAVEYPASLEAAVRRLSESGDGTVAVVSGDRLVGLVTAHSVSDFLAVREALGRKGAGEPA